MLDPRSTHGAPPTFDRSDEPEDAHIAEHDTGDVIARRFGDGENVAARPRLICMGFGVIRI